MLKLWVSYPLMFARRSHPEGRLTAGDTVKDVKESNTGIDLVAILKSITKQNRIEASELI